MYLERGGGYFQNKVYILYTPVGFNLIDLKVGVNKGYPFLFQGQSFNTRCSLKHDLCIKP